jgi:hypothetical protein
VTVGAGQVADHRPGGVEFPALDRFEKLPKDTSSLVEVWTS